MKDIKVTREYFPITIHKFSGIVQKYVQLEENQKNRKGSPT